MNSIKKGSLALLTVLLSILLMACPTEPTDDKGNSTFEVNVKGNISGSVQNFINSGLLNGVVVAIAKPNGESIDQITTNSTGLYAFENLVPGDYVLTFSKEGFESATVCVYVSADQYKSDDPLAELEMFQQKTIAIALTLGIVTDAVTETSNSVAPDVDNKDMIETANLQQTMANGYEFAIKVAAVKLAPITASITGKIEVQFTTTSDLQDSGSVKVAGKEGITVVFKENNSYAPGKITEIGTGDRSESGTFIVSESEFEANKDYIYTTTTIAGGTFTSPMLPAGRVFDISVLPFSQGNGGNPEITYNFDEQSAIAVGKDVMTKDNVISEVEGSILITPTYDDAVIIQHNIGDANNTEDNKLSIDPTSSDSQIVITFSKSMDPDTLDAQVIDYNSSIYTYYKLEGSWDSASTTVTLSPLNTGERLDYDFDGIVNSSDYTVLDLGNLKATDGSGVDYDTDVVSNTTTLGVYTISSLAEVDQSFDTSAGNHVDAAEFPVDGIYTVEFNKPISSVPLNDITLTGITDFRTGFVSINGSIVTFDFSYVDLAEGVPHTLFFKAKSSDYEDEDTHTSAAFTATSNLKLLKTNIYDGDENNIYYEEGVISSTANILPINNDLTFTFNTAIDSTSPYTVDAKLYKQEDIDQYTSTQIGELIEHEVAMTSVSTSGEVLTLNPASNLEADKQYVVAIKITNTTTGDIVLYTKTSQFDTEYSGKVVAMEQGDANVSTTYIAFTTEQDLRLLGDSDLLNNNVSTNLLLGASNTTDFLGTSAITLEFNKPVNITGLANDFKLYHVYGGKDYETSTTVTVIPDTDNRVISITPDFTLAPGKNFKLVIDAKSSSSTVLYTYSNEDSGDVLTFTTTALDLTALGYNYDDVITGGDSIANFSFDGTTVHGTQYTGYDSTDSDITNFKWDSLDQLHGSATYSVYLRDYENLWKEAATPIIGNELSFLQSFMTTQIEVVGTNALPANSLLGTRDVDYVVVSFTDEGFLATSSTLSVTDTVAPTIIAFPGTPTSETNSSGSTITRTYDYTMSESFVITGSSLSSNFADTGVTASIDYAPVHNNYTVVRVTVTIPDGDSTATSDTFTITGTDTSNNTFDVNRNNSTTDSHTESYL